ncbi:hypothetical protein BT69DRAFT_887274 [Atractiella rhizophila]|nr:hypothetical protein BT69DRAFT_887274 [Atractiella rhizophila]
MDWHWPGDNKSRVDSIKQQENQKKMRTGDYIPSQTPQQQAQMLLPGTSQAGTSLPSTSGTTDFTTYLPSLIQPALPANAPQQSPVTNNPGLPQFPSHVRMPSFDAYSSNPTPILPPLSSLPHLSSIAGKPPTLFQNPPPQPSTIPPPPAGVLKQGTNDNSPSNASSIEDPHRRMSAIHPDKEFESKARKDVPVPPSQTIEYFGIELFFSAVYPIFPLVHEGEIRTNWASGLFESDTRFAALIFSMCAIAASQASLSSVLDSHYFSSAQEAGETFFQLSLEKRGRLITAEDAMDVQTTYFLGQWAANAGKEGLSWHYMGEAIRLGLGLGLHTQREEEYRDFVDREVRRRILWQLFTADKNDALVADRPMVLRSDELTVPFPLEVDDEYITPTYIHPQPPNKLSLLTGFNAVNRLWKIFEELILGFRADRRQLFSLGQPVISPVNELRQNMYRGLNKVSSALDGLPPALIIEEKPIMSDLDLRLQIQRANLHVTRETMSLVFYTHYSSLIGNQDDPYVKNSTIIFKGQTASRLLKVLKTFEKDELKKNGGHLVMKVRIVIAGLLEVIQLAPDPMVVAQASRDLADYLEIMANISIPTEEQTTSFSSRVAPQSSYKPISPAMRQSASTTSHTTPPNPTISPTDLLPTPPLGGTAQPVPDPNDRTIDLFPYNTEPWNGAAATPGVDWNQPFWTTMMGNINF